MKKESRMQDLRVAFEMDLQKLRELIHAPLEEILRQEEVLLSGLALHSKDGLLLVSLDVEGKIAGKIDLEFKPGINTDEDMITIDQLEFNSTGSNFLSKAALWLAENFFRSKIERIISSAANDQYRLIKAQVIREVESVDLGQGITMNAKVGRVKMENLRIEDTKMLADIYLEGVFRVIG